MKLEICVEDAAGIDAAVTGGADRIELCSALSVGGLTPPLSLIRRAAACPLPVHLLARPRAGDFRYSPADLAMVAADITAAAEAGLAGVVIGASRTDRRLDTDALAGLTAHARSLAAARGQDIALTLHRAFDLCPDLPAALEEAVSLGFDRILTSGGQPRAVDATDMLARLQRASNRRIGILAGSGINADTLPAIMRTGVTEVHASCRTPVDTNAFAPELRFGFLPPSPMATDAGLIRRLAKLLASSHST